jgi:hypothetical protein
MVATSDLTTAIRSLKRTFHLDGVLFFRREDARWQVEATVGNAELGHPDEAPYSAEIARDRILALAGKSLTDEDARLLSVFLDALRLARKCAVLQVIEDGARRPSRSKA